jgi:hypothetical protein
VAPKIPPEMDAGFLCEGLPNGWARVYTIWSGRAVGYLDCPESELGTLAGTLLSFASMLASRRVDPGASLLGTEFTEMPVAATRAGLVHHPQPGLQVLAFQVGDAQIGFALPRALMHDIGQTFLAASADDAAEH